MKLASKKRKHISVRIRCVVSFFVFCQANLILVPFPAHRQQVPSLTNDLRIEWLSETGFAVFDTYSSQSKGTNLSEPIRNACICLRQTSGMGSMATSDCVHT